MAMLSRAAFLLTPSDSIRPSSLPFYKHRASISPLFATLRSRPQIIENALTLSPFLATHTDLSPVSPVFATHTKTTGVYTNNSHSETHCPPLATHSSLPTALSVSLPIPSPFPLFTNHCPLPTDHFPLCLTAACRPAYSPFRDPTPFLCERPPRQPLHGCTGIIKDRFPFMARGNFGERLKREREMREVSLEELTKATRISTRFLLALENEDWEKLPGGVFESQQEA